MNFAELTITSPKRVRKRPSGWDAFFPYYAGYPASFASQLIESARLKPEACIFDPWNGSGTTTFAALAQSYDAVGLDLNPAMIVVARARSLQPSEADSLVPLAAEIVKQADARSIRLDNDPLFMWFDDGTSEWIRSLEYSVRQMLVGDLVTGEKYGKLNRISAIASTFYVALFAVCRRAAAPFRASNPTWLKKAKRESDRIGLCKASLSTEFLNTVQLMASSLAQLKSISEIGNVTLLQGSSVQKHVASGTVDLVLTSPPYCTRIDYTAATKVELAVLGPLLDTTFIELGRNMIGSTRVCQNDISVMPHWGSGCLKLLADISAHPSKASKGYYTKTHVDYFYKMDQSLAEISDALKNDGSLIMVVQDSYYKEVHNDLPTILCEMANYHGLQLRRKEDFALRVTLAASHQHAAKYNKPKGATESVLCFSKS